jgi:hypothetical protein
VPVGHSSSPSLRVREARLLGERNWYLPQWLGWLPHLSIEGPEDDDSIDGEHEAPARVPAVV